MLKSKKIVVQIREDDGAVVEVEVNEKFIEFYKKETNRSKVSAKSLSNFINHLVEIHSP